MSKIKIKAIAAMDEKRGIGISNALPWNIPEDMKHFVALTTGHTVLMGRRTFESAPMKGRPLKNRLNVIITRTPEQYPTDNPDVLFIKEPLEFIKLVKEGKHQINSDTLWIIGGAEIYNLTLPLWDEAHITIIPSAHECDAFFPLFEDNFKLTTENNIGPCRFLHYVR